VRLALHAEWTKWRTTAGPVWLALGVVAVTVAMSAAVAATIDPRDAIDPVKVSLTGVQLGQTVVAVLAVLVAAGEYGTGMVHMTLTAVPRRTVVLAAKAWIVAGPVSIAGVLAVAGSLIAGRRNLEFAVTGAALRAAAGSVLYLVLIGLLSLGIAVLTRNSTVAIGVVLGLLYLFPILLNVVSDPHWQRRIQQIAPSNAGLAVQATVDVAALPIGPWAGLGVVAAWAAGALVAGGLALNLRDA
jgi:ABC-2 type transport system permease protein